MEKSQKFPEREYTNFSIYTCLTGKGNGKLMGSHSNTFAAGLNNLVNKKWWQKVEKPCRMGTYLIVLGASFLMNTNMTGLGCFSYFFAFCALEESKLSSTRAKGST